MRTFDVFLNFDGDCRAAIDFYAGVFGLSAPAGLMTYDEAPGDFGGAENAGRILYASLPIFGCNVMFSDCPAGSPYVKGTNIALTLGSCDTGEIEAVFAALADGGNVLMPLGKTFFSEFYGMVSDRFGVTWQISLPPVTGK